LKQVIAIGFPKRSCLLLLATLVASHWLFTGSQSAPAHPPKSRAVEPPQLVLQTGHSQKVSSVAYSPDNHLLASGSVDRSIGIWDVASGRELRRLTGHANWVNCVAFSPDGKLLASGSNDKSIKLWDIGSGSELRTFTGHENSIQSIAFSPDGRWLASGSSDNTIRLWEIATGSFRELKDHSDWVTSVVFSPDGKWLASGSRDNTVRIWDVNTGRPARAALRGHTAVIKALAFSPDGQWLASGSFDGTVKLWKTSTGKEAKPLKSDDGSIVAVMFVENGSKILTGTSKNVVSLWETASGHLLHRNGDKSSLERVESSTFSPDGRLLASGEDSAIALYDAESGSKIRALDSRTSGFSSVGFSANNSWLATGGKDKAIRLWDISSGRQLAPLLGHAGYVTSIALSRNGKYVASASIDHTIRIWDTLAEREIAKLTDHDDRVEALAFSPDDRWLASASYDRTIRIWKVDSWQPVQKLSGHSGEITAVAFSPDGKFIASGSVDKTIRIRDTTTWSDVRVLTLSSEVRAVAFSADSKLVLSGAGDTIKFFDIKTGSEARALQTEATTLQGLSLSPDGRWLASAHNDKAIRLWDLGSFAKPRMLVGHSDNVNSVTFSPDGKQLASSSDDGSTIIWDPETGQQLVTLLSLRDSDDWLAVTPDGLFDGSPPAWGQILWRFGGNTFSFAPVEAFFSEFYYPGLLAEIIAGKKPHSSRNISEKDRRQPLVTFGSALLDSSSRPITGRKVDVKIELSEAPADKNYSTGSGIRDVRLFRNGSLVKVWHDDLHLNQDGKVELQDTVQILAGRNVLTAYAFNRDNIKSNDETLVLTGDEKLKRGGTLYILTAGINEYANSQFNLRYAVDDAKDFGEELRRAQSGIGNFSDIKVIPLIDREATRENILLALNRLGTSQPGAPKNSSKVLEGIQPAQPEDAVVIYFAGHGTVKDGRFYLIPHDLGYTGPRTPLDAAGLENIIEHSISDRDLERALEQIDAGLFLLVIDACKSGQALESEEKRRGPMNSKGLPQLAYEKGMYILTAAQSYQAASERRSLGHGYLTYALVEEGLKTDAADIKPRDGQVGLKEWLDYAVGRVPRMQAGTDAQGRLLEHEEDKDSDKKKERDIQRPMVFYRAGLEAKQLVVARPESK
jgi:WD40 repeat protein/uncharacterized caspase-like protein